MISKLLTVSSKVPDDTDLAHPIEQYLKKVYGAS